MMSRRKGEVILIGDEIEIVIAHIGRSRVRVGIRAPRNTAILAREVKLVRDENVAAVALSPAETAGRFLKILQPPADEVSVRHEAGK
ncbi:MAG TPA: carbon storage regulator [Bryobacteraceae bacterium]|jgi:carbon storage regulator|nr:carbon storage regulator [Bryobacteraceae bacterium]